MASTKTFLILRTKNSREQQRNSRRAMQNGDWSSTSIPPSTSGEETESSSILDLDDIFASSSSVTNPSLHYHHLLLLLRSFLDDPCCAEESDSRGWSELKMLQRAASNAYSWWWASHIRTKQSKWLDNNLEGLVSSFSRSFVVLFFWPCKLILLRSSA